MLQLYKFLVTLLFLMCFACEQNKNETSQHLPLFIQYIESAPHSSTTSALVQLLNSHYRAYQIGKESIHDYPYVGGFMALVAMNGSKIEVLPVLKELYAAGADIKMTDETGITALHFAALLGDRDAIKWLTEKGASEEQRTGTGASLVMYAAWGGHIEILKEYMEKNPNLHDKDNMGQGIHVYAAFGGSVECLKYLKDKGLDITEPGNNGVSSLIAAGNKGDYNCIVF